MVKKKGWESKCQLDSQALKVRNRLDLLLFQWHATYHWKVFNKGYNFTLNLTLIKGLNKKLWASRVTRVSISRILGQNDIWMQPPWLITENIIRGKVVASLKYGMW
jgi:hypothetical protein